MFSKGTNRNSQKLFPFSLYPFTLMQFLIFYDVFKEEIYNIDKVKKLKKEDFISTTNVSVMGGVYFHRII